MVMFIALCHFIYEAWAGFVTHGDSWNQCQRPTVFISLCTRNPSHPTILLIERKPLWINGLHSALKLPHFPWYKECRVTGLSFSFCKWGIFIPRTDWWASEFFNVINVNVTLLECTLSFRWIFYSFVTKAFQTIKYTLYFLEYLKVQ